MSVPAILGAGRWSPPSHPWWGRLMPSAESVERLIREIEVEKGRMSTHEQVCAERYRRIDEKLNAIPLEHTLIRSDLSSLEGEIKKVAAALNGTAWKANWKAWAIASALFATLLGALTWTGGQLYALEPARVTATQSTSH